MTIRKRMAPDTTPNDTKLLLYPMRPSAFFSSSCILHRCTGWKKLVKMNAYTRMYTTGLYLVGLQLKAQRNELLRGAVVAHI